MSWTSSISWEWQSKFALSHLQEKDHFWAAYNNNIYSATAWWKKVLSLTSQMCRMIIRAFVHSIVFIDKLYPSHHPLLVEGNNDFDPHAWLIFWKVERGKKRRKAERAPKILYKSCTKKWWGLFVVRRSCFNGSCTVIWILIIIIKSIFFSGEVS